MASIQYANQVPSSINAEMNHDASLECEVGDIMFLDEAENNVKPAGQFADHGSAELTQRAFAKYFAGFSLSRQLSTDSTARRAKLLIDTIITYPCESATFEVGDYVAPTYTAGVLSDQSLTKVTDPSRAIGKVIKREASAVTTVKIRCTSPVFAGSLGNVDWQILERLAAPAGDAVGDAGAVVIIEGGQGAPHTSSTAGAGGAVTYRGGAGGIATTGTGGAGGAVTIGGAAGGTATTGTAGAGAAASLLGGAGGAASAALGTGGVGGAVAVTAGAGGAASHTGSTAAGVGGAASVTSGAGGASSTTAVAGGAGGTLSVTGGAGGAGAATGTGGAGASLAIAAGAGGATSGAGTGGAGGNVTIAGGAGGTTSGGTAGAKGTVTVQGLVRTAGTTAAAIAAATVLTLADSGGIFNIDQDAAFDIDLPSPTVGAGLEFTFVITDAGSNNVTITVLGGAATFVGTIHIDGTTIAATGATLTFASGTAVVGDWIRIRSLTTGLYHVEAMSSVASAITIA